MKRERGTPACTQHRGDVNAASPHGGPARTTARCSFFAISGSRINPGTPNRIRVHPPRLLCAGGAPARPEQGLTLDSRAGWLGGGRASTIPIPRQLQAYCSVAGTPPGMLSLHGIDRAGIGQAARGLPDQAVGPGGSSGGCALGRAALARLDRHDPGAADEGYLVRRADDVP
jgi:hypothetical protein